jgi:putative ABC transport system permease protein
MLSASLRNLLSHKVRLVLTALAIALGVAFMSGTFTFTATLQHDLDSLFRAVNAGTDVIVQHSAPAGEAGGSAGARPTIPADLLDRVRATPGVAAAEGVIHDQVQLTTVDGQLAGAGPGVATTWRSDPALAAAYPLHAGRAPSGPGEMAIDQTSAATYGYHVGDSAGVVIGGRVARYQVTGIVGFGTGNGAGRSLVLFPLPVAQELFGKTGRYDHIEVRGSGDRTPQQLRDQLAAILPADVEAVTGEQAAADQSTSLKSDLGFLTNALLTFAGVAVFVGGFVIWNTFSILVAQRTRELALLRALGASRRQVLAGVLTEAVALAVVSSAAGVGLGLLAARGLAALMGTFGLDLPSTGPRVPVGGTALAVLTGIAVTVVAAIAPARRATRVAPVAALRDAAPAPYAFSGRRLAAGLAVSVIGLGLLGVGLFTGLGNAALTAGTGAVVTVLGVNLLAPLAARPVLHVLGAPLRRFTGRLAHDNAAHNPGRTAATAAALMIGLAAVSGVAVLIDSVKGAAAGDIGRASKADLYVTPGGSDGVLDPALAQAIAARPGVAALSEVRRSDATVAGAPHTPVYGVDPATIGTLTDLGIRSGGFGNGGILVSTKAASAHRWHIGSTIDIHFGQSSARTVPVVGTFANRGPLGDYLLDLPTFDVATGRPVDSLLLVKAGPGSTVADLRTDLTGQLHGYPGAQVLDRAGYQNASGAMLDQILNLITGLLVLAVIIALLGIVNTLALSVSERTRELGVLRAIGMRRGQLATTVTIEAGLIAVFGALLGIGLGIGLGAAMAAALIAAGTLVIPAGQLTLYLVVAVLAAVLAAAAPARHAAGMNVLTAIATE